MTAHAGIIPSDQAQKLYAYPALNGNQSYGLQGDGTWSQHYCSISTAASEPAKVAACTGFKKTPRNWLIVFNEYSNTADSLTLNVNNTGAGLLRDQHTMALTSINPKRFVKGMYLLQAAASGDWLIVSAPIQHYCANVQWFTCTTAAATAEKVVSAAGFVPMAGVTFPLWVDKANTATTVTLNINGTGATEIVDFYGNTFEPSNFTKGLYLMGVTGGGKYAVLAGPHRAVTGLKYFDGFAYSGYGNVNRFINCTTAAGTAAKTATTSMVIQYTNGLSLNVFLKNANTAANPTLNVNNLGAIPIVDAKGAALTGAKLTAGLHNLVYYDSKFYDVGVTA